MLGATGFQYLHVNVFDTRHGILFEENYTLNWKSYMVMRGLRPSIYTCISIKESVWHSHLSISQEVLLERPRVISAQVAHAWDLPANTFGAAYARFMGSRNFSPDDRPPVRFMETDELAYVAMRAREVHDFWHTLFDLATNLIGESALKVIEFEQMYLPMCLMSVVGGSARFSDKQRRLFFQHYFPWATRAGVQCTDLMCLYYEKHFHEDLEELRRKWGITPAPLPAP